MATFYNEIDPFAAAWLRALIRAGELPDGPVDERDLRDLTPGDLEGYTQCHFFAGIGGWALALRLAGWPADRPVWTGSCPCQPFSSAGAGVGGADERHLWPAWFHLIAGCRPPVLFGEQVEAAINFGWLDLVCDDLEGIGYAVAPVGLPAASVGAFHIRQRLWFVADAASPRSESSRGWGARAGRIPVESQQFGPSDGMADDDQSGRGLERQSELSEVQDASRRDDTLGCGGPRDVEHPECAGLEGHVGDVGDGDEPRRQRADSARPTPATSEPGIWDDVIWLPCRDGKTRPTQPGLQPLAHGVPHRVGTLRGAGNAIVPQVGALVIQAYLDTQEDR